MFFPHKTIGSVLGAYTLPTICGVLDGGSEAAIVQRANGSVAGGGTSVSPIQLEPNKVYLIAATPPRLAGYGMHFLLSADPADRCATNKFTMTGLMSVPFVVYVKEKVWLTFHNMAGGAISYYSISELDGQIK